MQHATTAAAQEQVGQEQLLPVVVEQQPAEPQPSSRNATSISSSDAFDAAAEHASDPVAPQASLAAPSRNDTASGV